MQNDQKKLEQSTELACSQSDIAISGETGTIAALVGSGTKPKTLRALVEDESGTTTLEWLLLLGAIAIPSIYIFTISLNAVVDYYRMMTTLNSLPFP